MLDMASREIIREWGDIRVKEKTWDTQPACKLLDREGGIKNGIIMDDGAFHTILSIGKSECGSIGQEEMGWMRVEPHTLSVLPKCAYILDAELLGVSLVLGTY